MIGAALQTVLLPNPAPTPPGNEQLTSDTGELLTTDDAADILTNDPS